MSIYGKKQGKEKLTKSPQGCSSVLGSCIPWPDWWVPGFFKTLSWVPGFFKTLSFKLNKYIFATFCTLFCLLAIFHYKNKNHCWEHLTHWRFPIGLVCCLSEPFKILFLVPQKAWLTWELVKYENSESLTELESLDVGLINLCLNKPSRTTRRLTQVWEQLLVTAASNRGFTSKIWDLNLIWARGNLVFRIHPLPYLSTLHHPGLSSAGLASPGPASCHRENDDHFPVTHTWTSVSIIEPWFFNYITGFLFCTGHHANLPE